MDRAGRGGPQSSPMRASLLLATALAWSGASLAPAVGAQTDASVEPPAAEPAEQPETPPQPAELPEVILIMKGGQRMTGLLVSRDSYAYVLRISGVDVRILRDDVEHMAVQRPALERYREIRALIDDGDVERLLQLVEWLRERALLDEAMEEVEHVLSVEPDNPEALRLRLLVSRLIALRDGAASNGAESAPRTPSDRPARPARAEESGFPLLTEEQINVIKVYEVDINRPPRLLVSRETVERLLQRYADHPLIPTTREGRAAFHRKPAHEILDVMFRVRARELYPEVRVIGNPESMTRFRDVVNRGWFVTSCASSACHGGDAAGPFMVYNRRSNADDAVYTNFLILERHRLSDGSPMVNYDVPERSGLLQMGLPRDDAAFPHPDVRGWRPVFRNAQDRRFRETVDWIMSMYTPRPEHPVDYTPPKSVESKPDEPVER